MRVSSATRSAISSSRSVGDERDVVGRVDAQENARRKKQGPCANRLTRGLDVPFDPAGALLDALVGRGSNRDEEGAR